MSRPKIGILLSGRGSNFEAIAQNIQKGTLDCEIALVCANKATARGLARARELGLPAQFVDPAQLSREAYDQKLAQLLEEQGIRWICLAGYMRLLSRGFVERFEGRILNIHPSLLPSFPGLNAQQQALDHGVKVTGCTVHFVDGALDNGPILAQSAVPVEDGDTVDSLSARILVEEHRLYSQALAWVLKGNYRIEGRRVVETQHF